MSKKKPYEDDQPAYDPEPAPAEPAAAAEGADVAAVDEIAPHVEACTANELLLGWWKNVKDTTPGIETFADNFAVYAAERGWSLVQIP